MQRNFSTVIICNNLDGHFRGVCLFLGHFLNWDVYQFYLGINIIHSLTGRLSNTWHVCRSWNLNFTMCDKAQVYLNRYCFQKECLSMETKIDWVAMASWKATTWRCTSDNDSSVFSKTVNWSGFKNGETLSAKESMEIFPVQKKRETEFFFFLFVQNLNFWLKK